MSNNFAYNLINISDLNDDTYNVIDILKIEGVSKNKKEKETMYYFVWLHSINRNINFLYETEEKIFERIPIDTIIKIKANDKSIFNIEIVQMCN